MVFVGCLSIGFGRVSGVVFPADSENHIHFSLSCQYHFLSAKNHRQTVNENHTLVCVFSWQKNPCEFMVFDHAGPWY